MRTTAAGRLPLLFKLRIVSQGISLLRDTLNTGLCALLSVAGIEQDSVSSQSVVFGLVPRINATGRMGSVDDAVELLLCEDAERAMELARRLDALNTQRKEIEAVITDEILGKIKSSPLLQHQRMLIVAGEGWHHGVVGIVASKMVERFGKPCLLISIDEQQARGSGRSVEGFNLVEAISFCSSRLSRYGGHNQAAGCSMNKQDVDAFTSELLEYCKTHYDMMPAQTLVIDREIIPSEITVSNVTALNQLEPFGEGNPLPVFLLKNCKLEAVNPVGEGKHLRLRFQKGSQSFFAMYFGMSPRQFPYQTGDLVDLVCNLSLSEYNGEQRVTVKIKDLRFSGLEQEKICEGKQAYDKYVRGEMVLPEIADAWAPAREEIAQVYRTLKAWGSIPYGCDASYVRLCGQTLDYIRIPFILELLLERGLAECKANGDMPQIELIPRTDKVDITASAVYQKIQNLKLV